MFHVPFQTMICVYVAVFAFIVAAVWLLDDRRRRRQERRGRQFHLRCRRCALEWEDRSAEPLPKCPRCGSFNERDRLEAL